MNKLRIVLIVTAILAILFGVSIYAKGNTSLTGNITEILEPQVTNSQMLGGKPKYEIESETVKYFGNVEGFFAKPKEIGEYPGIVMIHEWWGLNANIKDMAKNLAGEGYLVLAVDLYSGKVASSSDEAKSLTASINKATAISNMKSAVLYLQNQGAVKTASFGWCFGGGQSLQLALSGQTLDATVIYYGSLEKDKNRLASIKWPVLGIFGSEDQSIHEADVKTFEDNLDSLNIINEIYIYPGVGHAFANPTGANFAADETKDAWNKTLTFLNKHLRNENQVKP